MPQLPLMFPMMPSLVYPEEPSTLLSCQASLKETKVLLLTSLDNSGPMLATPISTRTGSAVSSVVSSLRVVSITPSPLRTLSKKNSKMLTSKELWTLVSQMSPMDHMLTSPIRMSLLEIISSKLFMPLCPLQDSSLLLMSSMATTLMVQLFGILTFSRQSTDALSKDSRRRTSSLMSS